MKCLTIAFVVSFLIFSSCDCQEISLDAFSLISSQLNFLDEMCYNRTGEEAVFEKLQATIKQCEETFLNGSSFRLTLNDLTTVDPKEFFKFYSSQCSNKRAIQLRRECNVNVKILLSQCLDDSEMEAFNKIEDIAQRLFDVICSMKREKMKNFFSAKGQECLVDNVISIGFCFLQVIPEDIHAKQELLFQLIEDKECRVIEEIEDCMMTGIDSCEEKSVSQIFRLLFNFIRNELSCAIKTKEAARVVSGSDKMNVSIVLLTSLIVLALCK